MLMKRWFQAAVISRVLFLVDRIELAKQAKETFDDYLRDWLVPAKKIIDNGYNMTLSGLELIKPETVEYPEPEEILASVAAKEERILELIQEMRELLEGGKGK